jgi:CSLREA domain-containing protein
MHFKATARQALARSLVTAFLLVVPVAAFGATITVTTAADDLTPNDGTVSLREAMTAVNAGNDLGDPDITAQNPGAFGNDHIQFNIPGAGVHTITLTAPLPILTKVVQILGYTQPGATMNSLPVGDNAVILIRIDQNGQGSVFRLDPGSDGTAIEGLALVNTSSTVIDIRSGLNVIGGNFIGVDTDGVTQTGSGTAVNISPNVAGNQIGVVLSVAFRNVMASSNNDVVATLGNNETIAGNYINTNAAGTAALGNVNNAINVGAGTTQIGGVGPSDGNVIGQWNANGINVGQQNSSFPLNSVTIIGNKIGVNATGAAKLSPGLNGVALLSGNYAGVVGNGFAGNVISGAALSGIALAGAYTGLSTIYGNNIGTDITGTVAIPNGNSGICITSGAGGTIGNSGAGQPNVIAFNGTNGITIGGGAVGFQIQANSIFNNGGLGISLAGRCDLAAAPTANDAGDADTGANNLQNYPVVNTPVFNGGNVILSGSLNSTPLSDFTLDFYSSTACDASGNGEGRTYLGSQPVSTDNAGNVTFTNVTLPVPSGQTVITATATDTNNPRSTSEFSACAGGGPPLPTLSINNVSANEGNSGTTPFTFTVTLSAASASTVTVGYATADGTATAPSDYAAAAGTLTFAPGVTTQTVTVNVNGDTTVEPNETFTVTLSAPSNATIATGTGTGTILNDDSAALPTLSIANVSAAEGNSGTTPFTFTVTLSAASASTVTVAFATADGSAVAGSDYAATSGTLTFAPGVTSQTITVNVNGDTTVEPNETFVVNLSAPVNATLAVSQGVGTILNDDASAATPATVIPTLDPRALILLTLLLALAGARFLRRSR